jgi:hypothetical protein
VKQARSAGQLLPDRQAQFFEPQPGPVRHPLIGVHGPHQAPQNDRGQRDRLITNDHASEHAAARTKRSQALHLDALRAQVDHVDRAPGTERGLRHAQHVAWEPRFSPAIRQGVIHCPVPG